MADASPVTLRPIVSGVKNVCVIDTDSTFLALLEDFLSEQCHETAKLVGVFERIPDGHAELRQPDVVIFDPRLPEFRDISGIARVQSLYGERIKLMARLPDGSSAELREDLEASGVRYFVRANDFTSIVEVLNMLAITPASLPPIESVATDHVIRVDGSEPPAASKPSVHVCIITEDEEFCRLLGMVLMRDLGNAAKIEGSFSRIPRDRDLMRNVKMRLVIFDPEADAFRDLPVAIRLLRIRFGENALLVVRTDNWKTLGNRHSNALLKAGIQAGCARDDYVGFAKLAAKLRDGKNPKDIVN